jgi:hypothetical protein
MGKGYVVGMTMWAEHVGRGGAPTPSRVYFVYPCCTALSMRCFKRYADRLSAYVSAYVSNLSMCQTYAVNI